MIYVGQHLFNVFNLNNMQNIQQIILDGSTTPEKKSLNRFVTSQKISTW